MSQAAFVQPTIWVLTGGGIQVRFSVAGPDLHYQDIHQSRDFTGAEVRLVDVSDLGTLASVTLHLSVDSGSTSFTLLLPRVNLPPPPALPTFVPVETDGITTVHHFSLVPGFQHGQQDTYTVTRLRGSAA